MSPTKAKKKNRLKPSAFEHKKVEHNALLAIIERASLCEEDRQQLKAAVDTLAFLTQELEKKGTTLARLRKMLFGPNSEKTKDVLKGLQEQESPIMGEAGTESAEQSAQAESKGKKDKGEKPKQKPKGHGRNAAEAYVGAERVPVEHETLQAKDNCPCCQKGKVYEQNEPAFLVRVVGVSPLNATVYEKQRLRCNLCGEVFTAQSPEGVGDEKYDETAAAMIALLKYGCGLPFHRIEKLGQNLGIPLPASTQWDVVEKAARALEAVWAELVRQAAQGSIVHIDDTKAKVLALNTELQKALEAGEGTRTGVFTSGIVSTWEGHQLVLFFTGIKHAGENLESLLKQRAQGLEPPIQMCDALAANTSGEFETIVANCLVHARRHFVDLANTFPDEVCHVLKQLGLVYKYDAEAKDRELTPDARLRYHQENSKPVMDELHHWLQKQWDEKLVEPNSAMGGAIKYMKNHWQELTLFLRVAGAPLDNNIVERALKRVILHRKNSLFYKTENGALVGDMFMSLIHTAELAQERPFEYLVELQRHQEEVKENPAGWMPWNYRETLGRLSQPP